jgi:TolB protein
MDWGAMSKRFTSLSKQRTFAAACLAFVFLSLCTASVFADEPAKPAENKAAENSVADKDVSESVAKERFTQADKDGDGQLSPEEFVIGRGDEPTARRDFKLFDFDRSGVLSPAEFAPIAVSIVGAKRGPMPDPFMTKLVDVVGAALDKSLKNWNEHPEVEYDATEFVRKLSERLERIFPDEMAPQADADRNGKVNRAEARRFLEIQFGVRRSDGQLLRDPNGMYVNYNLYVHTDLDRNDIIERKEFVERSYSPGKPEEEFDQIDANKDGVVTYAEFVTLPRVHNDPIEEFRRLDKNLDAKVDADEIQKIEDWKKPLSKHLVKAFDLDRDETLSLEEWMVTPHANTIVLWFREFKDFDGDKKLGWGDFTFNQNAFPLLRLYFYRRFDRNGDNALDTDEFEFRLRTPCNLYSINADGTDLKTIDCGATFGKMGSPAVSPDGKWVAFDGAKNPNENLAVVTSMIVPIEGGEFKSICAGLMPTWSKDGLKIACSRYQPEYGPWIIDLAGEDDRYLGQAWGAQWSPDGKKIFFNQGALLQLYDVETQQTETVMGQNASEYRQFEYNACWSPDSQRVCIRGWKGEQENNEALWDVLIVDLVNKDKDAKDRIKVRLKGKGTAGDFAWHPEGKRIVCCKQCPERKLIMQLYEFDPDTDEPPTLFPGQPEDVSAGGASWTPDGKKLIFTAGDN